MLQRAPGLRERHPRIVDHLALPVPRVLLIARPEGKGGVDEITIDIVELEPPAARLKCGFDPLRTMIVVPQLRRNEDVLPLDFTGAKRLLHGVTDRMFIAVALR